jgi:hypothetical protein
MRTTLTRLAAVAGIALSAVSCTTEEPIDPASTHDDEQAFSRAIEGAELAAELASSPAREAPVPFVRLGLMWDAPVGAVIEIATSADGEAWSDWRAVDVLGVEAEGATSFVGALEVEGDEPALWYRVRSPSGDQPSFVYLEFLEQTLAAGMEDGAAVEDDGIGSVSLGLSVGGVGVNTRASWNARAPRCVSSHSPARITIHHTVTPTVDSMSPQARLRQIQSFHQNVRGWCDIGYQFLVSRDGRLWEGRGATRLGAHVANANTGNVGISMMGTYTSTQPTATQLDRIAALVRGLHTQFGIAINTDRVKGHRNFGGTSCPGDALYAKLGTIRSRAQAGGGGGGGGGGGTGTGTTLKGLVYKGSNTSARLAGATVVMGSRTTTTSAEGYYQFTAVAAGAHTITASKAGYTSRSITRTVSGSETWGSIGLSASASAGTAVLVGVVYRGSNSADRVGGATVKLSTGKRVTADADGYYRITALAPGAVTITASKAGLPTHSVSRTLENGVTTWGSVSL